MFLYTFLLALVLLVLTELTESRRIVGGSNADISKYPHQISLRFSGEHDCGGSIYQPNIIITAAHCVVGRNAEHFSIAAGFTLKSEAQDSAKVKKIIIHEKYSKNSQYDYDIAILVLDRNLEYNSKVQPIRLQETRPPNGVQVTVTGWGRLSESGPPPDHLQKVEVELISNDQCVKDYKKIRLVTDSMLCARIEGGGKDSCGGDSGGPLMFEGKLIGVVSWGRGCARKEFPGVYASVPDLYDWISKTVENNTGSSA